MFFGTYVGGHEANPVVVPTPAIVFQYRRSVTAHVGMPEKQTKRDCCHYGSPNSFEGESSSWHRSKRFFPCCLFRTLRIRARAPIPDLPDRKTICIMERGNEKCQPKNENTQRRRVTMRPSRRGQCGWSPSRGGPAGRWPRNSASASTRCAAG